MGNAKVYIPWDKVKDLLKAGLGAPTIANKLRISSTTLYDNCVEDTGMEWKELREEMMKEGSEMLQAKGFEMAINGDRTMLIFYLKNRCNFADHVKVDGDMPEGMIANYKKAIEASNKATGKLLGKKKGRKQ